MKKYYNIFLFALTAILLVSCSSNDIPGDENPDKPNPKETIEIGISFKNYTIHKTSTKSAEMRAIDAGTPQEQEVQNFYLFLFDTATENPKPVIKLFVDGSLSSSNGVWENNKLTLNKTQAEAGDRLVYIVANCADLLTDLNAVNTVANLEEVVKNTEQAWSPDLKTPILMVGSANHSFIANRALQNVPLVRALAKIELNIDLEKSFQTEITTTGATVPEYQYRFVNFDKETYVIYPGENVKTESGNKLKTSEWMEWPNNEENITVVDGVATKLKLSTYLNERFTSGAHIEIRMNYHDGGLLPPPEFGFETYTFPTFDKVERNHKYVFDAEVSAKVEIPNP